MLQTPIAFFIWQRPSLTAKVFARIREMRPQRLIIIADGPKEGSLESSIRCQRTRAVVETIDWPCEVIRDYAPVNMGLQDRIESGLDFVFSHVERAIILEDDCLPDRSFFPFVEEMLELYAEDERVGCVGGDKPPEVLVERPNSYGFTHYTMIWGWATWRRVWQRHDRTMALWPAARATGFLERLFRSKAAVQFWTNWFDRQYHRDMMTWDIGLTFSCWLNGMHSIIPCVNLVTNIGFGADATHTHSDSDPRANQRARRLEFPLCHPSEVRHSPLIDSAIERTVFSGDSHAFGSFYQDLCFARIRHAFGHYLDGCAGIGPREKLALLQEAERRGAAGFHLLSDESCRSFLNTLHGSASVVMDEDIPLPPTRSSGGNAGNLDADGAETIRYLAGFSTPEGPYPNLGIGKLHWMMQARGIFELPRVRGGDYLLLIGVGNVAHDQRVDIVIDGNHAGSFDVAASAWDPIYRLILPVTLLPGDVVISIYASSYFRESSGEERHLYLAVFGATLVRSDGEAERKRSESWYGKHVADLTLSQAADHTNRVVEARSAEGAPADGTASPVY